VKQWLTGREDGQTLVYVALAMVALLAFVALAVDGGHVYAERRRMQNAADAGALAGAYEICFGSTGRVVSTATDYAVNRNGAQSANVTQPAAYQVNVVANETTNTFFAGVIGLNTVDITAEATAACGAANSACGLWPIAFNAGRWDELFNAGCGKSFYVWAGNNDNRDPDCFNTHDCDLDNDGVDDLVGLENRTWIDFSDVADPQYPDECVQSGCGTSELACLIASGSGTYITLPACIPGDNGERAGIKDEVESRVGDLVAIPLFTSTGCPAGRTCPGGETYYATRFGCIEVRGWEQNLIVPRKDGSNPPWRGKVIEAAVACDECDTYCGSTPGGPPQPGGVNAVSLTQ
jgi:hypothetical protein